MQKFLKKSLYKSMKTLFSMFFWIAESFRGKHPLKEFWTNSGEIFSGILEDILQKKSKIIFFIIPV